MLFAGILLTGVGSSYYHWNPNDDTLLWDRLPITLCLHGDIRLCDRGARECDGRRRPVVAAARASACSGLLVWRWTDDLRLYAWVQFFPCIALPVLFLLFPAKYTGTSYWIIAAALYVLAKLAEYQDRTIYSAGSIMSGHTLKHLLAAAACFAILRYFQTRRPIA